MLHGPGGPFELSTGVGPAASPAGSAGKATGRLCIQLMNYLPILTLWLLNIAMENGPFIDGLPIKNCGSFHGYVKSPEGTNGISRIFNT